MSPPGLYLPLWCLCCLCAFLLSLSPSPSVLFRVIRYLTSSVIACPSNRRHPRQASSVLGLRLEPEEEGLITGLGAGFGNEWMLYAAVDENAGVNSSTEAASSKSALALSIFLFPKRGGKRQGLYLYPLSLKFPAGG